jgi:pimeloyl-ACP methyl ester carboxylesterase
MQTLGGAEYMARHLPNARLITLPAGGHLLIGQEALYQPIVQDFLERFATNRRTPAAVESGA